MGSLPRILTVDPTGKIPQQVRGAVDLMDRLIIQIDVPGGAEALDELKRAACTAVISAWTPGGNMAGWELAAKVKQIAPNTPIIILADINDTDLDEEMRSASPFIYLKRPFDMAQFLRVLTAALDGEDLFEAMKAPEVGTTSMAAPQYSAPPPINLDKAGPRVHALMTELGSAAVLLCTRDGKVIIEQGVVGYMNRDELSLALVPGVVVGLELRDMLHGNLSELQFYDGDEYDVFVVSVGLHYFLIVIFDGQKGARELGNVSRYGRRCAEDLIALQGMDAWLIERVEEEKKADAAPRRSEVVAQSAAKTTREEPEVIQLTPAFETGKKKKATTEQEVVIPETPKMAAIEANADDLAGLFDDLAGDSNEADDMFSLENMEELAKDDSGNRKGTITWEDAAGLGLVSDAGGGGAD